MKIKFPGFVTRQFYLYLKTLKFLSYATNVPLFIWLESFHFGSSSGAHLFILSIKKVWPKLGKNYRMIQLTWKFPFWVFERCSFLIWLLILLILCIYFDWRKIFCGQNLSKKQEWSLRLEKFQVKCWNFETVTYFNSNPVINAFVLSDVLSDVRVT